MASLWDLLSSWGQNYNPDPGSGLLSTAQQPQQAIPGAAAAPIGAGLMPGQAMPQAPAQPAAGGGLPSMASGQFPALNLNQKPQGFGAIRPPPVAAPDDSDAPASPVQSGLAMGAKLAASAPTDIRPAAQVAGTAAQGGASSPGFLDGITDRFRNIYGNGGAFDPLINLGIGMNSGPGGTQRALEMTSNQQQQQKNNALQQLNMAVAQAKLARETQAQQGTAAFIKSQYAAQGKPITDDQAAALASNSGAVSSLVSSGLKDTDKAVTTVTDPVERAQLGIAPNDNRVVQKDANGKISFPGAGGVQVNLGDKANGGLDGKIVDTLDEGRKNAVAATGTLQNINHMGQLLDNGQLITGAGADWQKSARNALATALGIEDNGVSDSQAFAAAAQAKAATIARSISGAGHTTNADLDMAKVIGGAAPDYTKTALRQILQWQQQSAMQQIQRHNDDVNSFSKIQPDAATRAGFFKVDMPENYNLSGTPQPASSAPGTAPARLRYNPATGSLE